MSTSASLATVHDLEDWLGEPISEEADQKRAGRLLGFASSLIRLEAKTDWLDSALVPEEIRDTACAVAARVYTNPDAATLESVDDAQVQRKVEAVGIYLTATEKQIVARYAPKKFGGLGVVSTTRGDWPPRHHPRAWLVEPYYEDSED